MTNALQMCRSGKAREYNVELENESRCFFLIKSTLLQAAGMNIVSAGVILTKSFSNIENEDRQRFEVFQELLSLQTKQFDQGLMLVYALDDKSLS